MRANVVATPQLGMRTGEIAVLARSATLMLAGSLVWREWPNLASCVGIVIVFAAA
jgi:hypothetical protein